VLTLVHHHRLQSIHFQSLMDKDRLLLNNNKWYQLLLQRNNRHLALATCGVIWALMPHQMDNLLPLQLVHNLQNHPGTVESFQQAENFTMPVFLLQPWVSCSSKGQWSGRQEPQGCVKTY
jgi:hypothetical protein